MKVSDSWLREWVNPSLTAAELADQITMAGLEVDSIEPVAAAFSGVVVGEIIACEQHPDADKLRVCLVAGNGAEPAQVVCGAPNARVGIKVPFATVGAELPPGEDGKPFKIRKAKLRGVESFGMLCAQTELQLGDDASGLWELSSEATVGLDLREFLQLNDCTTEVDLTPNRGDCLSIKGIAREVGVLNRLDVTQPDIKAVAGTIETVREVSLEAGDACSRYLGRVIEGIDVSAPSPLWLQERLRRAGSRSIDAVVDVTNYVLLELGQPLHAFDQDKLQGNIRVRLAAPGESLELLDARTVELSEDTLLITDSQGPLAMAGIMGGKPSSVTDSTRNVFLESAYFSPLAIAGRARSYGLHTDASHRYERGVDPQLQRDAIERATQLLIEICGGQAGPIVEATNDTLPGAATIRLRQLRIESGLGISLAADEIEDILQRLGLRLLDVVEGGWVFEIPSWRFDLAIEEDLLEEIARVYGYNRLPTISLRGDLAISKRSEAEVNLDQVRDHLVSAGYQEAITYSFVSEGLNANFSDPKTAMPLQNPISAELGVMRGSLLPGLVNTLVYNLNRQQTRVRLFECGRRFAAGADGVRDCVQEPMLAGLIYGSRLGESWSVKSVSVDFFDLKGDFECLLASLGVEEAFEFIPGEHSAMHPGQCAQILREGQSVGVLGALHPKLQQRLDIPGRVFVFEVSQSAMLTRAVPKFSPLSKFPEVRRDLAVVVDQEVSADALLKSVKNSAGDSLTNLKIFDVYMGKGIDPHRKSVALGLTYQHPSRTLKEEEINASIDQIVATLEGTFKASLR